MIQNCLTWLVIHRCVASVWLSNMCHMNELVDLPFISISSHVLCGNTSSLDMMRRWRWSLYCMRHECLILTTDTRHTNLLNSIEIGNFRLQTPAVLHLILQKHKFMSMFVSPIEATHLRLLPSRFIVRVVPLLTLRNPFDVIIRL